MFRALAKILSTKNAKGLIIGYPLDHEGKPMKHCNFVERWVEHMWSLGIGKRIPVTLVNEYSSSLGAKVLLAEAINNQNALASGDSELMLSKNTSSFTVAPKLNATDKLHATTEYLMKYGGTINPEVMLRKGIYDKLAA